MPRQTREDFYVKHYSKLIGKTVTSIVHDGAPDNEQCFGLCFSDGTVAWINCDEEGNGPGFLDIQERG